MKRDSRMPRPAPRGGFTLIEVLIALGIFLGAMMAILGIYFQNLRLARMAREEIIIAMIQRDVMARNAVVASTRAGHERGHKVDPATWPTAAPLFSKFGSPRDGTEFGTGAGEVDETGDPLSVGWGVRNIPTWEAVSALHWGRSDPAIESDVPLYENFFFTVTRVIRHLPLGSDLDWDPDGGTATPGLAVQDSQFTDWDGYGKVDLDGDGVPETDRGVPYPSPGPILADNLGIPGADTYDTNPLRIFYDSNQMQHYFLRLRVRIMWRVLDLEEVYNLTDAQVKAIEDTGKRVFSHTEYYFSVFNPDIVKRWQPKP